MLKPSVEKFSSFKFFTISTVTNHNHRIGINCKETFKYFCNCNCDSSIHRMRALIFGFYTERKSIYKFWI